MSLNRALLVLIVSIISIAACGQDETDGRLDESAVADQGTGDLACSPASCPGAGMACVGGQCVEDCRRAGATACIASEVCDYTDGVCRAPGACVLTGDFSACPDGSDDGGTPTHQCGPGSSCSGNTCVPWTAGCTNVDCDTDGRCWGINCPCTRAAPTCSSATLTELNAATFQGGAFDLDFDAECNAYTVTLLSGPDYLRQLAPDGTLTTWDGTTNLNMGEVRVKRLAQGEFNTIGDIAATYICCATCGCVYDGVDNREGVVHLDRNSTTRPLPNVFPAQSTSGTGPFGTAVTDTGPYGLVWGTDGSLYVGNVTQNGILQRLDLTTNLTTTIAQFPDRIVTSAVFDPGHLLIALQGGKVYLLDLAEQTFSLLVTLAGEVTSIRRDLFTGDIYAEIIATGPQIVVFDATTTIVTSFQTPAGVGRLTIAPDGLLYHLTIHPGTNTSTGTDVVSWPLPATR